MLCETGSGESAIRVVTSVRAAMSMRAALRVACETVTFARSPAELSQKRFPSRAGAEGSSEAADG